jgi:signal recognition particle subunit SRP19
MWKEMRKQEKAIIWPAYFDATKTRNEGRRIPKNLAIPLPRIAEIKDAADRLRLDCELVADVAYPATPWLKTGMLLVKKKEPKEQTIRKIAKQLPSLRGANEKK